MILARALVASLRMSDATTASTGTLTYRLSVGILLLSEEMDEARKVCEGERSYLLAGDFDDVTIFDKHVSQKG